MRVTAGSGHVYWVDATTTLQGGGLEGLRYLPFQRALVVGAETRALETVPSYPANRVLTSIHDLYTVPLPTESSDAPMESERIYEGPVADSMRAALRSVKKEDVSKLFLSLYQSDVPTLREERPAELDDDREGNVLRIKLHFVVGRFWTFDEKQGRHVVQVAARSLESMLHRPPDGKRAAPLALVYPLHAKAAIDLYVPFDVALTPGRESVGDETFELGSTSAFSGRRVSCAYDLVTRRPTVPVEHVAAHVARVDDARALLVRSLTWQAPRPGGGFNWTVFAALLGSIPLLCFGVYRA